MLPELNNYLYATLDGSYSNKTYIVTNGKSSHNEKIFCEGFTPGLEVPKYLTATDTLLNLKLTQIR